MKTQTLTSSQGGFTMVEIAMALLVAAIGLMGIFALFPAGLTASRAAMDDSRVALLAESVLSDLRADMDVNFANGGTFAFQLGTNAPLRTTGAAVKLFGPTDGVPIGTCKLTISLLPSVPPNRLAEARLECSPGIQTERTKVFYTRIADRKKI